jgi:pimeloyl-ACP methyl ester carboxylesterase
VEGGSGRVRISVGAAELAVDVDGDARAPLVILSHGFPDCARTFRHQVPALLAAGYRVAVPTLRGYAPSTVASDGRYDASALGGDLCALARHLSPSAPVHLVGHDWGAVASYAAVARAPGLFASLCTAAVPHPRAAWRRFFTPAQLRRSWYAAFFQLRGVAERRLAAHDFALVDRLWRDWSPGYAPDSGELALVKNGFREPSHLHAVLGFYRALAHRDSGRLLLRRARVPALYVHGERDGCVGIELAEGVDRAYAEGVEVVRIGDAGHFVHLEAPDAFNRALLGFLGRNPQGSGVRKK